MVAASTIWMSGGWMASGPPATGTCQTMVMYGVDFWTVPWAHGAVPVICRAAPVADVDGPHVFVRWCHCTSGP